MRVGRRMWKTIRSMEKDTGKLSISHRSTAYPCSVPGLGRLAGAGRIGLTRGTKVVIRIHISSCAAINASLC